ncbi:MAG: flagellar biosynthetic protein FliO [Acidobacteria bacterium]|nr:flagellar biosynthetic protein FliO [Acidobacteriota bacterium]
MEQFLAVLAVLGLLGGCLWLLRKKGLANFHAGVRPHGERRLQVLERLPLSASHSLHLVRFAGRVLLVGISPGGCQLLDRADAAAIEQTADEGRR